MNQNRSGLNQRFPNAVGGKSPAKRQAIFAVVGFSTLIVAAYYAKSKLGGNA